ncbi:MULTISPECIES: phosphotransferase enzyme family protein [Chryseobacterium]|uniref:phosphotransferase enzyme family protein n=1 Tax=Chryseobacterium TaxID=59732 RepID=UPI0012951EEF|nr:MULTISPECIES: phosphotransferase [Chryseobacterium]MDR6922682.1 Ser/Thr protein kinase RdoA (MazF antagonist) [Chryseobacterium sp. 2987]
METIFPAVYSTLCPVALSSLISEKYGLKDVMCRLLVRGVGDTYLAETSENRFILRVYRASHRSLQQIEEEVTLLLALKQAGVSVSYPIKNISEEVILKINAAEGERCAVLFSYAPGQVVRMFSQEQLYTLGNEMARFHNVSSNIQLGNARWNFDFETTILMPLKNLQSVFTENPEDYFWLQNRVDQIHKKLTQIDASGFSKGYCHFDFLPKNFHFENNSVTFFDFDFMGYGWLVNDLMTFWQHLALDVYTGKMTAEAAKEAFDTFLKGYREFRSVSEQEVAMIPYLAFGFWLFYMNFHTTHDQFYVFSQPGHLKWYVGILKNVVENYWEKENSEFQKK